MSDPFVPASALYDPATGEREPREWPMPIAAYTGDDRGDRGRR